MEGALKVRLRMDNVPSAGSIVGPSVSSDSADLNAAKNVEMEVWCEPAGLARPSPWTYGKCPGRQ